MNEARTSACTNVSTRGPCTSSPGRRLAPWSPSGEAAAGCTVMNWLVQLGSHPAGAETSGWKGLVPQLHRGSGCSRLRKPTLAVGQTSGGQR